MTSAVLLIFNVPQGFCSRRDGQVLLSLLFDMLYLKGQLCLMLIDELPMVVLVFRHFQWSLVVVIHVCFQVSKVDAVRVAFIADNREAVVDSPQLARVKVLIKGVARYEQDV